MSRGGSGMSGANNIPLGSRPPGMGSTFGKGAGVGPGGGPSLGDGGGGGSLLKPAYLSGGNSNSGFQGFNQPPPPPPGGGGNVKMPNMDVINSINAALGHKAGSKPPPVVGPGVQPPPPPPQQQQQIASAAAEAAKRAAASINAGLKGKFDADGGESGSDREPERKRKRKSRWGGSEAEKTFIPGMPTMLPSNLSKEQEEAYLLQLKIEDASRRLRTGDFGIPPNPEDRSPSPEPIYSSDGKRMNTREYRKRKTLEETRHEAIQRMIELNGEYKPPSDYKPPQIKVHDKVMIPQEEHPEINFVGLLIGPRGNTLKSMEKDTGAKIIIRGKGSVKEGKVGRKDGQPLPGEDEPLHAYVTATNLESVKKAVAKIKEVIQQGVEVPEGQNDLRRNQLRELALLNGTLREGEAMRCSNCGADDHKSWQCQDKANVTNNIVCTTCGGVGHPAKDCVGKRPGSFSSDDGPGKSNIDEEYMSLMAELGEGPAPPPKSEGGRGTWQEARTGQMFNRPGQPRAALPAPNRFPPGGPPPPPPPPGTKPPSLMQQNVPPPWDQPPPPGAPPTRGSAPPPPPGMGGWNQPPPPGSGSSYPPYFSAPPPPPPPPPTTASGSSNSTSWSAGWGAGSAPPPPPPPGSNVGPVPPPSRNGSGGSGHGWGGWGSWQNAPPPPPPPGAGDAGGQRVNLSSLISAPPPPPPS